MNTRLFMPMVVLALAACGADPSAPPSPGEAAPGQVAISLDVGPSVVLDEASYTVVGPHAFSKSGAFDVSSSSTLSALIGGIPADTGFTISLTAGTTDGKVTCAGSAAFDVEAGSTTSVELPVSCRVRSDRGGIDVGGTLNVCPVLDELSSSSNQVAVGAAIALVAAAHDSDSGPSPLSYAWSSTGGTLAPQGSSARLTCTALGNVTVSVTVGDGSADCSDTLAVDVVCEGTALPPAQPAPVPPALGALLGAGLLWLGMRQAKRRTEK